MSLFRKPQPPERNALVTCPDCGDTKVPIVTVTVCAHWTGKVSCAARCPHCGLCLSVPLASYGLFSALADLGATVVTVARPDEIDDARRLSSTPIVEAEIARFARALEEA